MQTIFNFISTGLLLFLGLWWNASNRLNSFVKYILFTAGVFGIVVIVSRFFS